MKYTIFLKLLSFLSLGIFFTSCQNHTGTGALSGAGLGGLIGSVYSEQKDGKWDAETAAKGAAIGGLAGGVAGAIADYRGRAYSGYGGDYQRQAPPRYNNNRSQNYRRQAPAPRTNRYQYGKRTADPYVVRSPHAPYSKIDVRGFRSGQVVADENNQPFLVP